MKKITLGIGIGIGLLAGMAHAVVQPTIEQAGPLLTAVTQTATTINDAIEASTTTMERAIRASATHIEQAIAANNRAGATVYVFGFDGTNFFALRGDLTNGLDVDVTRIQGYVAVIGSNNSVSDFTISAVVGSPGGATLTVESGVTDVLVMIPSTEGATDYCEAATNTMARAVAGEGMQIFTGTWQILEMNIDPATGARTYYIASASNRTLKIRIKKFRKV